MSKRCSSMMSFSGQTFDVFIAGLPDLATKTTLEEFGAPFGSIGAKVLFKKNAADHKSGFLTFACVESARCFIGAVHGQDPLNCGMKIVARFADGKSGERKKIHVDKLCPGTTDADLFAMGSAYGSVLTAKMLIGKDCGFITFSMQCEAEAFIAGSVHCTYNARFAKNGKYKRASNASSSGDSHRGSKRMRMSPQSFSSESSPEAFSPMLMPMPVQNFSPVQEFGNFVPGFPQEPMPFMSMPPMEPPMHFDPMMQMPFPPMGEHPLIMQ